MRKIYTLATVATWLLAGGLTSSAESYSYDFNEPLTINDKSHNLPAGWSHLVNGYESWYDDPGYVTYNYEAEGGVDSSGAITAGSQEYVYSGYYSGKTYDLLITPMISGQIKMMVKQANISGTITFYEVTPDGNGWKRGSQITVPTQLTTDTFREVSFNLEEAKRIGIRLSNVTLDDFYAETKEQYRHVSMTKVTNTTVGATSPSCDENNNFTISAEVTLTNDGDVVLTPDTENLYLTITTSSSNTLSDPVHFEPYTRLTEDLQPGESVVLTVSASIPYDEARGEYGPSSRYPCGPYLAMTKEFKSLGWIEPKPYRPEFRFRDSKDTNVTTPQSFGRLSGTDEAVSKSYKICNTGAAPMEVIAVTCPEGFVMTGCPETPFTIASGGQQELTITLNTDVPANLNSNLVISCTGLDDFTLAFSGIVLDPALWSADFEDQWLPTEKQFPSGVYTDEGWNLRDFNSSGSKCAAFYTYDDLEKHDYFITPLLEFDENDALAFDLARVNYSSAMDVYYSTDRKNWTLLKNISNSEITSEKDGSSYSSNYKYSSFSVTLPAGSYYIGFDANYCYLDNLYGGKMVDVAHDLMLAAVSTPAEGMVNYDYKATGSIRNILDKEEVVKITFTVNDEPVAETEVTVPALAKSTGFELSFLSNDVMDAATAKFVVSTDGYEISSDEWNIEIKSEELSAEAVTPFENTTTSYNAPWASNYCHTQTRIIYPEAYIPVEPGTAITGIKFYGQNTSTTVPTVSAWVSHTTDTSASSAVPELESMTNVTTAKEITPKKVSSSDNGNEILYIPFDENFTYEGGNLEIFLTLDCNWQSGFTANLITDESAKSCMASRKTDSEIGSAMWSTYSIPVTGFTFEAEPKELSGVITGIKMSQDTKPKEITVFAEGAVVTLTEYIEPETPEENTPEEPAASRMKEAPAKKVVTYSTTADENGEYRLPVLQSSKLYTLTVSHPDFLEYRHDETVNLQDGSTELNVQMKSIQSGVSSIYADKTMNSVFSADGIKLDKRTDELEPGIYIINGKKVIITRK